MHAAFILTCGSAAIALGLIALPASAQECPEGDWFCEPPGGAPASESGLDDATDEEETEFEDDTAAEPERESRRKVSRWRGRWVDEPPPPRQRRRHRPPYRLREWGFNAHVFAVGMENDDADRDSGMGGIGFGLRYRPMPHFAVDANLELGFGTDYNGSERAESALLANAVAFLNPRDLAQVYALAGLSISAAEVTLDRRLGGVPVGNYQERYGYFGMQLGGGVELRLSRSAALHIDLIGFIRSRTDDDADERPEFVDANTNRTTNTSGGALLRAGALFYW